MNTQANTIRFSALSLLLCLSACISINSNGYRQLSIDQRKYIGPYNGGLKTPGTVLTEIEAGDIKQAFAEHQYIWVYMWVPYCKGDACKPLNYYDRIAALQRQQDVSLFIVSQIYDLKPVSKAIPDSFPHTVYVIKDSVYGHNMYKGRAAFTRALVPDATIASSTPAHMVFKGNKLVYWAADISQTVLDSVVRVNDRK